MNTEKCENSKAKQRREERTSPPAPLQMERGTFSLRYKNITKVNKLFLAEWSQFLHEIKQQEQSNDQEPK